MLKNAGIGTKVTLAMTSVILAALVILSALSYSKASASMEEELSSNMEQLAQTDATVLSKSLQIYKDDVAFTASRETVRSLDWSRQEDVIRADAESDGFSDMGFALPDGQLEETNGFTTDISGADYFQEALAGKDVISDPEMNQNLGQLVVYFASPVEDDSGNVVGVVVGVMNGQFISDLAKNLKGSKSGNGFVINSKGTMIGNIRPELVSKQDNFIEDAKKNAAYKDMGAAYARILKNRKGFDSYTYDGAKRYVSYAPISGTTWTIGVVAIQSEAMAGVYALRTQSILLSILFILLAVAVCLFVTHFLVRRPLKETVALIQELSAGVVSKRMRVRSNDEVGRIGKAVNSFADKLQNSVLHSLKEIAGGEMNVQIDSLGEYDEIMPVVKETADTVRSIVGEANGVIQAVSEGDLGKRCREEDYHGDWKRLAGGINTLCDSVSEPIEEARKVIGNLSNNDYTGKMEGSYQGSFKALADDVNTVRRRLLVIQSVMQDIASGNTEKLGALEKVGKRSANDQILPAEIAMMRAIKGLIEEVDRLTKEAEKGNLTARGDAERFSGGFKAVVEGFNATLDAVSAPMSETVAVLKDMAVNDFTQEVTGDYQGDFALLKDALNQVRHRLLVIQDTAVKIAHGDIGELETFQKAGKLSEHDELMPALTGMMESIKKLIDETTRIAGAAAQGELSVRGKEDAFSGGYRDIVHAVNSFLDAVETPIGKIMALLQAIAGSQFGRVIEGEYYGQFKVLVDAANQTSLFLKKLIEEISGIIVRMSSGDFSMEAIPAYEGDFKTISSALNTILDSLNELFGNVRETAEQVSSGAAQVSQGSQSLSQGTTEQASTIEELSASANEIAAHTKQNARDAGKASQLALTVKKSAEEGNRKMSEMLDSMTEISEASKNISKIIKVIDDIAFQTNILSLNAAVEAARAGSYGKGFAVVAEEVRNLAAKSADAAKKTTDLIESTVSKVGSGLQIADNTAKVFADISGGINQMTSLVKEITAASDTQSNDIEQVNTGLEQVSAVIQTNSATAEESAAASEELAGQSDMLKEDVKKFTLRS